MRIWDKAKGFLYGAVLTILTVETGLILLILYAWKAIKEQDRKSYYARRRY